ncbi:CCR4-Not complex component, Not1-domain-containing protein [Lentinula raphanica]|nr:CCR4-Not complex component, Not1-domain-containing protein [Lentinula raphanica]KAJ3816321.1 CCR4-Not complex component, Not1-domain-containing protein [Lentinula raphanica]
MSRLIVKSHGDPSGGNVDQANAHYLSKILYSMEVHLGTAYFQLIFRISDTFISLQATNFPGFAFSWMCLLSHRLFMPELILPGNREGWSGFHELLGSLLKFLAPFLRKRFLKPVPEIYTVKRSNFP